MERWLLNNIDVYILVFDEADNIIYSNKDISFLENGKYKVINNRNYLETNDDLFSIESKESEYEGRKYTIQTLFSIARENAFMNELKEKAHIDSLTGVLNREGFRYEYSELAKKSSSFSIVMCDLDDFKSINDNFGHLFGDDILKQVSAILIENFRKNDVIARYGGDEFVLLIQNEDEDSIYTRLEKIQSSLIKNCSIKMSFGFTKNNLEEDIIENVSKADQALYYSKQNGKGMIVCYDNINMDENKKIKS